MPTPILFVSGAWLSADCWDPWRRHYERAGHICLAPGWPCQSQTPAERRSAVEAGSATLSVAALVDHYARAVRALPTPPILIGHALGGLIVQLLLSRGLGAAGVCLGTFGPVGLPRSLSALGAALPALAAWRGWQRIVTMTPGHFARRVAQTLTAEQQACHYRRFVVPAPGRPVIAALLGLGAVRAFRNSRRAPLLLVAGGADRSVPPASVRATYRLQARARGETGFRLFPEHGHLLMAEPGWEDIADYCRAWTELRIARG